VVWGVSQALHSHSLSVSVSWRNSFLDWQSLLLSLVR